MAGELPPWRFPLPLPRLAGALNTRLDRLVRPTFRLGRRQASCFRWCGYVGLAVAIGVSQLVVRAHDLSPAVMALLTLVAVLTFLALVALSTLVVGHEVIIYYHHVLAVVLACTVVLRGLGEPVLAYLDAVVLGLGGFLACGRIGCLLVGCCHGRPARIGTRYRHEHIEHGFTPAYVGVRLLPVPLLEALAVAGIVTVGLVRVVHGAGPGWALTWYVAAYAAVRSWLEHVRGDPGRPHARGLSQAQWTSLVVVIGVTLASWTGLHQGPLVVAGVALAITATACGLAMARAGTASGARHLAEVTALAGQLAASAPVPGSVPRIVGPTSAGVLVSGDIGDIGDFGDISAGTAVAGGTASHYGLSAQPSPLSSDAARAVARAILRARHPHARAGRLVEGRPGIHHLVVADPPVVAGSAHRVDRGAPTPGGRQAGPAR